MPACLLFCVPMGQMCLQIPQKLLVGNGIPLMPFRIGAAFDEVFIDPDDRDVASDPGGHLPPQTECLVHVLSDIAGRLKRVIERPDVAAGSRL